MGVYLQLAHDLMHLVDVFFEKLDLRSFDRCGGLPNLQR